MASKAGIKKNGWVLLIVILAGIVLGGLLGQVCANVSALSWLNYGQDFGLTNPFILDLGILVLTFGFTIHITIAGIVGILIGIILYKII